MSICGSGFWRVCFNANYDYVWFMRLKALWWEVVLWGSSSLRRVIMVKWSPFWGQWVTLWLCALIVENYGFNFRSYVKTRIVWGCHDRGAPPEITWRTWPLGGLVLAHRHHSSYCHRKFSGKYKIFHSTSYDRTSPHIYIKYHKYIVRI